MELGIFDTVIMIATISLVVNALFQRMKLPVIVGYILVGVIVGPHAAGLITQTKNISALAEFGIVFLMFTIGLEFSLSRIIAMRTSVFYFGSLQVFLTLICTMIIGVNIGLTSNQALVLGCITAMSSTAIVLKQLNEQLETNQPHGQHAVGILLFQDLAVIPMLMIIPTLAAGSFGANLTNEIAIAVGKSIAVILGIILIGRKVLKPLYYSISASHSLELFTLTSLIITLGSAWLTHFLGLSLTLGAFIAGMMLGETEFRHQIKTDTRALKDVLLGLFFVTIGMQLNLHVIINAWTWVALLLLALIALKALIIFILGLKFGTPRNALRTSLVLAQGGEFGIAILHLALLHNLLPTDYAQVTLGAILLSMCLAPLFIKTNKKIFHLSTATDSIIETSEPFEAEHHVIICGYGRVGQSVARFLEQANCPFVALDIDPVRVKAASAAGDPIQYADVSDLDNLEHAGLANAKMLVIGIDSTPIALQILKRVRTVNRHIPILVRAQDERDAHLFYEMGATEVIPDVLESSLTIAAHALLMMNVPASGVDRLINTTRHHRYDLLRMIFPSGNRACHDDLNEGLHVVKLTDSTFAVGKTIEQLGLNAIGFKITAVRRGNQRIIDPLDSFVLCKGDNVVLFGDIAAFLKADQALLNG